MSSAYSQILEEDGDFSMALLERWLCTGEVDVYSTSLPSLLGPDVWSGMDPDPIWPEPDSPQQPILLNESDADTLSTAQVAS